MAIEYNVVAAVYGALVNGDPDGRKAKDVTSTLQELLNNSPNGVVTINNETMQGDPAEGYTKSFGAIVFVAGESTPFAFQEGQTIDFS